MRREYVMPELSELKAQLRDRWTGEVHKINGRAWISAGALKCLLISGKIDATKYMVTYARRKVKCVTNT